MNFPIDEIRKDFPILSRPVNGRPLVYFDNGATAQTPRQVVEAMDRVYYEYNSNIHRGIHTLSNLSTEAFEAAREKVRDFINAAESRQIIFTRGTTEAINLVAHSDRKSTRLNSSHVRISYAVFCLKKKKIKTQVRIMS